jgi:hypothetical protein
LYGIVIGSQNYNMQFILFYFINSKKWVYFKMSLKV